jgi:hypothetical protein
MVLVTKLAQDFIEVVVHIMAVHTMAEVLGINTLEEGVTSFKFWI